MISIGRNEKKWVFLATGIGCFALVLGVMFMFRGSSAVEEEITPSAPVEKMGAAAAVYDAQSEPQDDERWAVYVSGEVPFPGVYEIKPGSRVSDAIDLAGGFTRRADSGALNLAAKLMDEAHVSVPRMDDATQAAGAGGASPSKPAVADGGAAGSVNYPAGASRGKLDSKIDINKADAATLATLPGMGPGISQAIVSYRDAHGPFADVDGLKAVKGIGEKRLAKIRELVKVGH
jgi:competence protein ComEA